MDIARQREIVRSFTIEYGSQCVGCVEGSSLPRIVHSAAVLDGLQFLCCYGESALGPAVAAPFILRVNVVPASECPVSHAIGTMIRFPATYMGLPVWYFNLGRIPSRPV